MYSSREVQISSQPHQGGVGLASALVSSTSSLPTTDPSSALYAMLPNGLAPSSGVDRPRRKFGKKSYQNYETGRREERSNGRREERSIGRREEEATGRREDDRYSDPNGRRREERYGGTGGRREERYEVMTDDLSPRSCSSRTSSSSRLTPSDYGSTRKDNKPQLEKKRRQREKQSLNKLRECILTAFKVDPSKYMDKAEILEKTVKFMQYIMSKHYSGEDVEWRKESKILESLSSLSADPNFERDKVDLPDGCNQFNISNSNNQNVKLHLINNNNRLFNLSSPTNNDQMVTLILPQFGPNFLASPYQTQPDNNGNCPINQSGLPQRNISTNFSDDSTTRAANPMKFVVNHNYYMNSPQNVKPTPTETFYREVLTPDTTTGESSSQCLDQRQALRNSPVCSSFSPDSSGRYLPTLSNSPRRIAPKLSVLSDQNNNMQGPSHLKMMVKPTPISNLHRPWEK